MSLGGGGAAAPCRRTRSRIDTVVAERRLTQSEKTLQHRLSPVHRHEPAASGEAVLRKTASSRSKHERCAHSK